MSFPPCAATAPLDDRPSFRPGARVKVVRRSSRSGTRFVGRTGIIRRPNFCDPNLLYVDLDATARARPRTEPFWTAELELIDPVSVAQPQKPSRQTQR